MTRIVGAPAVAGNPPLRLVIQEDKPYQGGGRGLSAGRHEATWEGGRWLEASGQELNIVMPRRGQNDPAAAGNVTIYLTVNAADPDLSRTARFIYTPATWVETSADMFDLTINPQPVAWVASATLTELIAGTQTAKDQATAAAGSATSAAQRAEGAATNLNAAITTAADAAADATTAQVGRAIRAAEDAANLAVQRAALENGQVPSDALLGTQTLLAAPLVQDADPLAAAIRQMQQGQAVTLDCDGDSTYYGINPADFSQVASPPPAVLQATLRAYYGNPNIVVINNGSSGNHTTNALRTWEAKMAATSADVTLSNYGINDMWGGNPGGVNDPAISAAQYKRNLRQMARIARRYNRAWVLETPNLVTQTGAFGSQNHAQGVAAFLTAQREVAAEFGQPLIERRVLTERLSRDLPPSEMIPDGFHPTQAVYTVLGRNMARPFIPGARDLRADDLCPVNTPATIAPDGFFGLAGSRTRQCALAQAQGRIIRMAVVTTEPSDLWVALGQWLYGTEQAILRLDGAEVGRANLFLPGNRVDVEVCLGRNVTPGLHLIEVEVGQVNGDRGQVAVYYARTRPARPAAPRAAAKTGGAAARALTLEHPHLWLDTDPAGDAHALTETPTDLLRDFTLEFRAELLEGQGLILGASRLSDGTIGGGVYLFRLGDTTLGYATGTGTAHSYQQFTGTGVPVAAGVRTYLLEWRTGTRTLSVRVDDAQHSTFVPDARQWGGLLGLYNNNAQGAPLLVRDVLTG